MKPERGTDLYYVARWFYHPIKAARALVHRFINFAKQRRFLKAYNKASFRGWHLGCGTFYLKDWLNSDIPPNPKMDFAIDITKPLRIADNFFDVIYSSEVIEHIDLAAGRAFFLEANRVLKPGGVFRLTTPDMQQIAKLYMDEGGQFTIENYRSAWLEGEFSPEIWVNAMFRSWGHQFIYSFDALKSELEAAGFENIQQAQPQITLSNYNELNHLDRYNEMGAEESAQLNSATLFLEAQKPRVPM